MQEICLSKRQPTLLVHGGIKLFLLYLFYIQRLLKLIIVAISLDSYRFT